MYWLQTDVSLAREAFSNFNKMVEWIVMKSRWRGWWGEGKVKGSAPGRGGRGGRSQSFSKKYIKEGVGGWEVCTLERWAWEAKRCRTGETSAAGQRRAGPEVAADWHRWRTTQLWPPPARTAQSDFNPYLMWVMTRADAGCGEYGTPRERQREREREREGEEGGRHSKISMRNFAMLYCLETSSAMAARESPLWLVKTVAQY